MTSDESSNPIIYYSLIAFNTKIICEVNEYNNNTTLESPKKKETKYIRASKKILKKIEQYEIRRPDGMGTLISGTYSYNYIHGYEFNNNKNYPLLESLIFLCVLPLYQSNPNVTSSEREIAFNFLSSVRRDFLTSFAENLQYIYNHEYINNISVRINTKNNNTITQLCNEDQHISNNLQTLSHIMIERMHGNYKSTFDYESDNSNNNTIDIEGEQQQQQVQKSEPENDYVNVTTSNSQIEMEHADDGPGYGSIQHTMDIENNNQHKSRINAFVKSIGDMRDRITSVSISSIKSFGTANTGMSDDKFVDYETMPLIGSNANLLSGEYQNNYTTSNGFLNRHKKKIFIMLAIIIVIYVVISMFCGFGFAQCT